MGEWETESGKPMQTYDQDQPWLVYTFRNPDGEIPAEGGPSPVECECAICGVVEKVVIEVPAIGAPYPRGNHPEHDRFRSEHVHKLQQTAPETWAKPLLNPDAHDDTSDILNDLAEKIRRQRKQD